MTGTDARGVALAVLRRVERDGAYADVALNAALAESRLDTRDRALAARLVYGTLAWQGRLDWHLAQLAARPADALDPAVRAVLRLGLYQLLLLDRIPAHAAVATSVDLAKGVAPAAAGLVNAVLRRAAREGAALPLPDAADPVRHLAVAYSHPEWLVARWLEAFGAEETRLLLAADNEAAPTVLRARPGGRDRLLADLAAQEIAATPGRHAPDAVVVESAAPQLLSGYARGDFTVQSEASQLVARLVDPPAGARVLDACAAPGGKATYLAELAGDAGLVLALDVRPRRAATIAAGGHRLGVARLAVAAADARRLPLAPALRFDRILVDAPCSGLGTLRAHPEMRWSRGPADVRRLATLQAEILDAATPHLAPGGALVYATCTIAPEENEQVVEHWLAAHPELERENAATHLPPGAAALVDASGALRTFPHRDGLDGFYAVRVRRRP
jgi:16S rRNA (cytosine967-C5)-methyltransferase